MITGHLALAYAARAVRKDASLAVLFAASIAPDLVDLAYAAAHFCSPAGLYSHSLPALAVVAPVTAIAAWLVTRRRDVAVAAAILVLLHTPADLITGYKYLWSGGPVVGLVLYEYPVADFLLEAPLVVAAWWLLRRTGAGPRWAVTGLALAALLAVQATFDSAKLFGEKGKPSACQAGELTGKRGSGGSGRVWGNRGELRGDSTAGLGTARGGPLTPHLLPPLTPHPRPSPPLTPHPRPSPALVTTS